MEAIYIGLLGQLWTVFAINPTGVVVNRTGQRPPGALSTLSSIAKSVKVSNILSCVLGYLYSFVGLTGIQIEHGSWYNDQIRRLLIGIIAGVLEATTQNQHNCYYHGRVKLCNIPDVVRVIILRPTLSEYL